MDAKIIQIRDTSKSHCLGPLVMLKHPDGTKEKLTNVLDLT